jgi:Carboxypeptidase regulatory-like domain
MRLHSSMCTFLLVLYLSLATPLIGQSIEGRLDGVVRDPQGAVIRGGTVTVRSLARGTIRGATTDDEGRFSLPSLQPGDYQVTAEATGFRRGVIQKVTLEVNQVTSIGLVLEVGQIEDQVEVDVQGELLERDSSALGQVIHPRQIVEMPLNGRNFIQLGLLSSGVTTLPTGGFSSISNSITNRNDTGLIINGNREANNSWLVDGSETRNPFAGLTSLQPSIDSIQEFKIQKSNYSAEFGLGSGIVNIITKSGTNDLHGSAYEFFRNDVLDARNTFDGPQPTPLRQNQWGFSLGGPIVHDRTYFFGSYESLREHRSFTIRSRFPDRRQLTGDFSSVTAPIFDPMTGSLLLCTLTNTNCPTQFAGNIIPPGRVNPIAKNLAAYWPAPNILNDPAINHQTVGAGIDDSDQFIVRGDHQLSSTDSLFARFSYSNLRNQLPGAAPFLGQIFPQKTGNFASGYTHIFRPTLINEFRFSINHMRFSSVFQTATSNLSADAGLKNLNDLPPEAWGLPAVNIPGYFTGLITGALGPPTPNSQFNNATTYQLVDNMTWIHDKHTMKFGFDSRKQVNHLSNGIIVDGSFTFQGVFYTGNTLADFVLGNPFVAIGATGVAALDLHNTQSGVFFQDDIRVSPKITLNLGLRYELSPPPTDTQDRLGLWDSGQLYYLKDAISELPTSLRPFATIGGIPRTVISTDKNDFAPRFGFAIRPFGSDETVVRGGYGVFFVAAGSTNFAGQLPPYVNFTFAIGSPFTPNLSLSSLLPDPLAPNSLLNLFADNKGNRDPYVQQWNLTIQRQLFKNAVFEVAYAGQAGHKLSKRLNANQAVPGTTPIQTRVPYPAFGEVVQVNNEANSIYHALQARLDKRFANDFSILLSYTWSKSIDNDSGTLEAASTMSRFDRRLERAASDFDARHRFVASYIYDLPFGSNKRWGAGATGIKNVLISGWQLSGITTFATGTPFTVTTATSNGTTTIFGANRPNRICDGNLPGDQRTPQRWFDTKCFVDHAANQFGNSGRNILRQNGLSNWDVNVAKLFHLNDRVSLQFRTELFNAFNISNFARPGAVLTTPSSFGVITQNNRGIGRAREIQFGLKLLF